MANTNFATMQAENTPVSFQDHNGKLEVIPSKDDYFIFTPEQVRELVEICNKWLSNLETPVAADVPCTCPRFENGSKVFPMRECDGCRKSAHP